VSDFKPGDPVTIYHNPHCTKSRQTLALIEASGIKPRVIEYLKTPPSEGELAALLEKLGIAATDLVRRNETVFREKYSDKALDERQWIKALVTDPILIERPIVVRGNAAVIGRPPENAKPLLK
jgi:arsenate reductase (glutaredoxin)